MSVQKSSCLDAICQCKELAELSLADKEHLANMAKSVSFSKNTTLWSPGETPDFIYLQTSGICLFRMMSPNGVQAISGLSVTGNLLGEAEVFAGTIRSNECLVLEDSSFLKIPAESIAQRVQSDPEFCHHMLRIGNEKFIYMMNFFYLFKAGTIEERLTQVISFILYRLDIALDKPTTIPYKFTQTSLAHLAGSSRPLVQKVLAEWKKKNIAASRYGVIEIIDVEFFKRGIKSFVYHTHSSTNHFTS